MDGLVYAHTMFNQSALFRCAVVRGVVRPVPPEEGGRSDGAAASGEVVVVVSGSSSRAAGGANKKKSGAATPFALREPAEETRSAEP